VLDVLATQHTRTLYVKNSTDLPLFIYVLVMETGVCTCVLAGGLLLTPPPGVNAPPVPPAPIALGAALVLFTLLLLLVSAPAERDGGGVFSGLYVIERSLLVGGYGNGMVLRI